MQRDEKQVQRSPNPEDLLLKTVDWIAEVPSLDPDRTLRFFGPLSSWDALCLIYILSHFASRYWITDDIYRRISSKAYQANYEGDWQIVQKFLSEYPTSPEKFYEIWISVKSPEEFFGNLRRRANRLAYIIKIVKRESPSKKVHIPLRPRGYRDKGTLRPPHEFHGDPPTSDLEKLDLRRFNAHPLLKE